MKEDVDEDGEENVGTESKQIKRQRCGEQVEGILCRFYLQQPRVKKFTQTN